MGDYAIHIEAVGDHGCQREKGDGEELAEDCGSASCVDCKARRLVRELSGSGPVTSATLTHWPQNHGPVDSLKLNGKRRGHF